MKNRLIINLLLAVLVIALGAVAWLKPGQETPKETAVIPLNINAINTLRIDRKNTKSITLKRTNQQWYIAQPFKAPALVGKIERLLKISQIKPSVSYPLNTADFSRFGLDKPTASITFNNQTLSLGDTESVNSRRYASNDKQLFLLDDTFLHHLTAPIDAYIDSRLLPGSVQITGLQTPHINLQQNDGYIWKNLLAPSIELSSDSVQMLLDEWRFARAITVNHQLNEIKARDIIVTFNKQQTLVFTLIENKNDVILIAKDSHLAYTFSKAKYKKMTTLPKLDEDDA
ncbi:MAG TPA: DUF4340 domain-containing protein [Cycloclasticus sp.]|jgi:hypothetical protein|nr:DUF4340 domain-containing protein [Cycloclasticus sp.]HIL91763.1 DUF4340 domain-containing protein [Cycloclasticus sp.]